MKPKQENQPVTISLFKKYSNYFNNFFLLVQKRNRKSFPAHNVQLTSQNNLCICSYETEHDTSWSLCLPIVFVICTQTVVALSVNTTAEQSGMDTLDNESINSWLLIGASPISRLQDPGWCEPDGLQFQQQKKDDAVN